METVPTTCTHSYIMKAFYAFQSLNIQERYSVSLYKLDGLQWQAVDQYASVRSSCDLDLRPSDLMTSKSN